MKRRHNRPISAVIKEYLDKRGRKVTAARKEIKWRFDAQEWKYQKQILLAFLQSGKLDREWVYGKLYACWDDCFIPVLQKLWEEHHEKQLSWLVIRFFPIDYLKKEFKNLSEGRNYYYLYQRLSGEGDFALDRTRLNEADLLSMRHQLGETITDDEIMDLFLLMIYKLCKWAYNFRFRTWGTLFITASGHQLLTLFDHPMVERMMMMIDRPSVANKLTQWMQDVTIRFTYEEGEMESCFQTGRAEYVRKMMSEYCLKYIAPKYKKVWDTFNLKNQQLFLDDLERRHAARMAHVENARRELVEGMRNSSTRKLIKDFDLEIVDSAPF